MRILGPAIREFQESETLKPDMKGNPKDFAMRTCLPDLIIELQLSFSIY